MPLEISLAESRHDFAWCIHIRTTVFVIEQNCPPEIEVDTYEDVCRHFIGRENGRVCSTARWRLDTEGVAKIERMAVLEAWRGRGVGTAMMQAIMRDIAGHDARIGTLKLGAQDRAIAFYERLGFTVCGEGFMDAGIPHHWMRREV